MNIVVDENISYAEEAFSRFGKVNVYYGRKISNEILKNADALIVRSITKVDKNLLQGTPVKFVGTATIGTDHIDLQYLQDNNIAFSDAGGCNADAVAEYVFTSILKILYGLNTPLRGMSIGIVGIGNIGSRVANIAGALGMRILKNDPPLQRNSGRNDFVPLNDIFNCDIITIHVPLNKSGIDKTVHLFNEDNIQRLKNNAIFINASRGQVVDNSALSAAIENKNLNVVLDVWENEPGINPGLLEKVKIGTPHIAGYSLEGKLNGTAIIYKALCRFAGLKPEWAPVLPKVDNHDISIIYSESNEQILYKITRSIYNIAEDDKKMRKIITLPEAEIPKYFDNLRKEYLLRREFTNYNIITDNPSEALLEAIKAFRLNSNI